jgi:hypothetical protein
MMVFLKAIDITEVWNLSVVPETVIEFVAVPNDSLLWTLAPHGEVSAI